MPTKKMSLGITTIECIDNDITITHFPGKNTLHDRIVTARPNYREEDYTRAKSLGYECKEPTAKMSRDHEICHTLLAYWLGLQYSPTLYGVATGKAFEHWQKEESAILAIQAFANAVNIDLEQLAEIVASRAK